MTSALPHDSRLRRSQAIDAFIAREDVQVPFCILCKRGNEEAGVRQQGLLSHGLTVVEKAPYPA